MSIARQPPLLLGALSPSSSPPSSGSSPPPPVLGPSAGGSPTGSSIGGTVQASPGELGSLDPGPPVGAPPAETREDSSRNFINTGSVNVASARTRARRARAPLTFVPFGHTNGSCPSAIMRARIAASSGPRSALSTCSSLERANGRMRPPSREYTAREAAKPCLTGGRGPSRGRRGCRRARGRAPAGPARRAPRAADPAPHSTRPRPTLPGPGG